jgi:hypothetical protein
MNSRHLMGDFWFSYFFFFLNFEGCFMKNITHSSLKAQYIANKFEGHSFQNSKNIFFMKLQLNEMFN